MYCNHALKNERSSRLPEALLEQFSNPSPDPVRVEEARECIGLVFEKGMKVPLQYEKFLQMRHDVVRFLFPGLPQHIQTKAYEISDQELLGAALGPYLERTITVTGSKCRVIEPSIRLLLGKSPAFFAGTSKISRPIERVLITFRKSYEAGNNYGKTTVDSQQTASLEATKLSKRSVTNYHSFCLQII